MAAAKGSNGARRKRVVKRLSFRGSWEEKADVAAEVGRSWSRHTQSRSWPKS
jgi:hypothetical protein